MARARNIKPGFFTNEELVELPFSTRLLFIGLWTIADREGRLEDKPKRIKMHLFPADELDVDAALNELQASGFLKRYEVDGARYIQVLAFRKHQNPHRDERPSEIPPMDGHGASTVQAPCEHDANPADSLIPDSPIADSSTESSAPAQPEPKPETPQRRSTDATATRLPADWTPDYADIEFCKTNRPDLVPIEVAARFRDYWIAQPGAKGRKVDWPATWRNWVRNEKQQARASPRQAQQTNTQRLLDRITGTQSHEPQPHIIDIN
jgi:hypothetical protein